MRELRLVGLSDDGTSLVMGDGAGHEFSVTVDDRLLDAVRRDRPRTTTLEKTMDGALRPRDIQARIRAGASVDDVVAESRLERDRVERYAGPVLAEREHVTTIAMDTEVRREETAGLVLSAAVSTRLRSIGVEDSTLDWDAWRREDGRWVVRVSYPQGRDERSAHWLFDPRAGSLVPDDAEARWLIDPTAPEPEAEERASKPRLASVVSLTSHETIVEGIAEVELADNDDDIAETVAALESIETVLRQVDVEEHDGVIEADVVEVVVEEDLLMFEAQPAEPAPEQEPTPAPKPAAKKSARNRRAAVPSWDDIVFGGKRDDE